MSNPIDYWYQKYIALKKDKEDMYLRGVRDMREQMMKDAVEGQVIDDGGDFKLVVPSLHTILKGTEDGEILKLIFIK